MKNLVLGFAALAALLIGGYVVADAHSANAAGSDLRVSVACTPLTSSQLAQPGDTQHCRFKVTNYSPTMAITGIHLVHNTVNVTDSTTTPASFDLAPYGYRYFEADLHFVAAQDGRGRSTATATGTQNGVTVSGKGTEASSLP